MGKLRDNKRYKSPSEPSADMPKLHAFKMFIALALFINNCPLNAADIPIQSMTVTIPLMEREASHRAYADAILKLALELSKEKYGPYQIVQQQQETVIRRQLLEVESGKNLSLAVSMPTQEWLEKTRVVPFPIMKGLASYRLFLAHSGNRQLFRKVQSLNELRELVIGQGQGWSTGKIMEDNGFNVVYGGPYATLLPMLKANRFQLLMRSIYEVEPELHAYQTTMPELMIVQEFGLYTYLPMYFFVSKKQPLLAERLEYGLKKAHANGQLDKMFEFWFADALKLLRDKHRKIFLLPNTNIDQTFFEQDKPYLLKEVIEQEKRQD